MTTERKTETDTPEVDACVKKYDPSSLLYQYQQILMLARSLERRLLAADARLEQNAREQAKLLVKIGNLKIELEKLNEPVGDIKVYNILHRELYAEFARPEKCKVVKYEDHLKAMRARVPEPADVYLSFFRYEDWKVGDDDKLRVGDHVDAVHFDHNGHDSHLEGKIVLHHVNNLPVLLINADDKGEGDYAELQGLLMNGCEFCRIASPKPE